MTAKKFEIKIALLGFVSVGKTTVLNALFRDKYGEVSMRRTTAGVNHFRIATAETMLVHSGNKQTKTKDTKIPSRHRSPVSTLQEITKDNVEFRDSNKVHEKFFDIELEEPLCKMRNDTQLVVVDIPGVNEAGVGTKYKDYVAEKWTTFDCVIVVVDGRQGVNTEEQVKFFEFIKTNLATKRDIPVIILCNKVDDPEDEEQLVLIEETRKEIERIFKVANRTDALACMEQLHKEKAGQPCKKKPQLKHQLYPAFIAISAIHAFIYQCASLMSLEEFKKFDKDLIEKLGREEVGRFTWKKLTQAQKFKVTHEAVSDQTKYRERLEATNFDKFLTVLAYTVGGETRQTELIESQLETAKKLLSPENCIAMQMRLICERSEVLGKPVDQLKERFWKIYDLCLEQAYTKFENGFDVKQLCNPMEQLVEYHKFACEMAWSDQHTKVIDSMKDLVRYQVAQMIGSATATTAASHASKIEWPPKPNPSRMTAEWKAICRSFLLLCYDKHFCMSFGREIVLLEEHIAYINRWSPPCPVCQIRPDDQQLYQRENYYDQSSRYGSRMRTTCYCRQDRKEAPYQLPETEDKVPTSLSDSSHWGHVAWTFCSFMNDLNDN